MNSSRNVCYCTLYKVFTWVGVAVALGCATPVAALAAGAQDTDASLDSIAVATDPHAHHRHMLEHQGYSRSLHSYKLPDSSLVNIKGEKTSLGKEVDIDRPVMLNFIFTTCTTICPVMSATFSQIQQQLPEQEQVRMISISIDPEHDTPGRLQDYSLRYKAGPRWHFLTGKLDDIVTVQKAFDAYRGSKVNHVPLTFLRASSVEPWVRLEGLASPTEVISEYRQLVAD